jgi:hypothetical protein
MKKILLLCGTMIALSATVASAAGLKLAWSNCYGGGGAHARASACASNTGNNTLVLSVDAPAGVDMWTAFEATLVFDFGGAQPDYWELRNQGTQTGQCRNGAISANAITAGLSGCEDAYGGQGAGGIGTYANNDPAPNQARLSLVFAIPSGNEIPLTPDTEYFVANVVITNAKTTGTGACAGCQQGVCVTLKSVNVVQPAGAPGGNVLVTNAAVGTNPPSNTAAWQTGDAICTASPTTRSTWGSVKSLYR